MPFEAGSRTLAEVRPRPVVGDEAHVVRRRDDEPGHRCALQAPHAVGEEGLRHAADRLHARGQRGHGRLGSQVVGEEDEAEPAPGQHGAEHEQGSDLPPVEHQHVARCPHPGPASPVVIDAPRRLGVGHRPAQIAGRPAVAGGPDDGQQTLGRDPTVGLRHPLGDDGASPGRSCAQRPPRLLSAVSAALAFSTARLMVLSVVPQISAAAR